MFIVSSNKYFLFDSRSILNYFSSNTSIAQYGLINFIEQQVQTSQLLGSGKEYRNWTLSLAQNLVSLHSSGFNTENIENRLRELCSFLLGNKFPKIQPNQTNSQNKLVGLNKHELLREVLSLLTTNLALQRLYIEFKEQLDSFVQNSTYLTVTNEPKPVPESVNLSS